MNRRRFLSLGRAFGDVPDHAGFALPVEARELGSAAAALAPYVPTASEPWDYARAAHLLRRAMVGPNEEEIRRSVSEGLDRTIERLMTPFEPSYEMVADWAGADPCNRPPHQEGLEYDAWRKVRLGRREMLGRWWLRTIVDAPVSIQERMTMTWHGHFTSSLGAAENAEWMLEQNKLFRAHALGNLRELVRAVSKDMAMLRYLDCVENYVEGERRHINENYARELMELFTVGLVDWDGRPNYTQADVREAARALTGWCASQSAVSPIHLGLRGRFDRARWDDGTKTILGRTGAWDLDDVVDILFSERAEAVSRFVCEKIYRALIHDVPDRTVIDAMAVALRAADWEMRPIVESLLRSRHFFDGGAVGAMPKSIVEYYLAMIRCMGLADVPDFTAGALGWPYTDLSGRMVALGQMLFHPPSVKGWPGGRAWVNGATLPPRQKFALEVIDGTVGYWEQGVKVPTYTFDPLRLAARFPAPNDPHRLVADMARCLLAVPPTEQELAMLESILLDGRPDDVWDIADAAQQPDRRLRRLLRAIVLLPTFQLH